MIWLLGALVIFLATALVTGCALALVASGREMDRREKREREMFRVLTARVVADELGPGAELRALRALTRDAKPTPFRPDMGIAQEGHDWDEIDDQVARQRSRVARDAGEGLVTRDGEPIHPTGSA